MHTRWVPQKPLALSKKRVENLGLTGVFHPFLFDHYDHTVTTQPSHTSQNSHSMNGAKKLNRTPRKTRIQ
ncbi:hypothetical protein SAMN06272722_11957 [Paenibacillus sp. RU5A]|nr:hypothetical protein SAMN06272722_11957 [Paenibacillus sp. RU5A]SOC76707.1 hypothetical protein SAMN05880581_11957 [Paenibacillus sp. RU26A]SOC78098.1 hypothetical protein SAMN05880586_11957 [Paenibacillus sp. RU5M]